MTKINVYLKRVQENKDHLGGIKKRYSKTSRILSIQKPQTTQSFMTNIMER